MSDKKQQATVKKEVYVLRNHTKCRNFIFAKGARFQATEEEIKQMNSDPASPAVQVFDGK